MSENPRITFCISVFNENLNYVKKVTDSIIKHSHFGKNKNADLILYNEHTGSVSEEWRNYFDATSKHFNNFLYVSTDPDHMTEEQKEKYLKWYYTGIGGGMNFCAERVKTEYIMFIHADMVVATNFDLEALKIAEKYKDIPTWISSQRFQPNLFLENSRPGTLVFPYEEFGYTHKNFDEDYFIQYAEEFSKMNPNIEYIKGEGVSGLIKKEHWDNIGGNDPIYAPGYWEDKDLWMRMQLADYKFVLTTNSVVFHFGSRSANSNFPDDAQIIPGQKAIRSERSIFNETRAGKAFGWKWGFYPEQNEHEFDIFPRHLSRDNYKHLIQLDLNKSWEYIKQRDGLSQKIKNDNKK